MITRLTMPNSSTATLENDGKWASLDARLAKMLDLLYSPHKAEEQVSRALPSWGRTEAENAADFYKAAIEYPKYEPAPDGTIF
jgi:hypothetical protein